MPTAVITGASSGIGRACAKRLRDGGFVVYAGVRSDADAAAAEDAGLLPLLLDVTRDDQVQAAATLVDEATGGRLDVLVNNAGTAVVGPAETIDAEMLTRQLDVNVVGAHRMTRALIDSLVRARGRIVQMSSVSGRTGFPFVSAYAASKHALEGYSDSLRRELRPLGVHVSIVQPASVATPIWSRSIPDDARIAALGDRYRARVAAVLPERRANETGGIPVEVIADAVLHAATAGRPRVRYPLPRSALVMTRLLPALPDRLVDLAIERRLRRLSR